MSGGHAFWLTFIVLVCVVLLGIAAMKSNGATEHPLLVDAQAQLCITAPPPMCKPQGSVDCAKPDTKRIV